MNTNNLHLGVLFACVIVLVYTIQKSSLYCLANERSVDSFTSGFIFLASSNALPIPLYCAASFPKRKRSKYDHLNCFPRGLVLLGSFCALRTPAFPARIISCSSDTYLMKLEQGQLLSSNTFSCLNGNNASKVNINQQIYL